MKLKCNSRPELRYVRRGSSYARKKLISTILHYLSEIGWSDLIDSRWRDDVIRDIKEKFPKAPNSIIEHILEVILV